VRRGLDLLLSQPSVDKRRIGFVGHDYGAMFGTIASGVDKRVKTYVLVAGMGNFSDWSLKYWKGPSKNGAEAYKQAVKDVDPIGYVPHAAPASLLFQFANNDKYISKAVADEFLAAASQPKEAKWYDATHDLNIDAARNDRRAWLTRQLRLANNQ
jgi:pimeloyl-ACP methyl ester carboxylesterase